MVWMMTPGPQEAMNQTPMSDDTNHDTQFLCVPSEHQRLVRVTGSDATSYLQRMLTQDVESMTVGEVRYACHLNPKGRTLGLFRVWRHDDYWWLDGDLESMKGAIPALERFVITEDVTFQREPSDAFHMQFIGSRVVDHFRETLSRDVPAQGTFVHISLDGETELTFARVDMSATERYVVWTTLSPDHALATAWSERGMVMGDDTMLEVLRVIAMHPRYGHELGEHTLFNEAYFDEAVSWTKGCYPGQEPVTMARHRGRPPRRLVCLAIQDETWSRNDALHLAGRRVGEVTSVAFVAPPGTPRPGFALALLQHDRAVVHQDVEGESRGASACSIRARCRGCVEAPP